MSPRYVHLQESRQYSAKIIFSLGIISSRLLGISLQCFGRIYKILGRISQRFHGASFQDSGENLSKILERISKRLCKPTRHWENLLKIFGKIFLRFWKEFLQNPVENFSKILRRNALRFLVEYLQDYG